MMKLEPITLEGRHARLVPLTPGHAAALWEVGREAELWRWTWSGVASEEEMRGYVDEALRLQAGGTSLPFATTEAGTGRVIGSTRFGNADAAHRRVEIGWSWVARAWRRSPVNTEAKYLMLRHAFQILGCQRVEMKTDALNEQSRAAMLRIGARFEGIFRKHGITADGRVRDTAWFSIVDDEWPAVRVGLEAMLARPDPRS
ncbi:MAG TPA: GNAT family protein [Longimicrobium sp.]|nr:GNAT family protein [Longimicrobium sp.]